MYMTTGRGSMKKKESQSRNRISAGAGKRRQTAEDKAADTETDMKADMKTDMASDIKAGISASGCISAV